MNLYELYDYAVDQGIDVDWYTMPFTKSFSIFIPSLDRRAIALDPWKFETVADEFTTLGHEVGHCMTYSFYNRWAACDIKKIFLNLTPSLFRSGPSSAHLRHGILPILQLF